MPTTSYTNNLCKKCGSLTNHHHYYCDRCYSPERGTIIQLKKETQKLKEEIKKLTQRIIQIKQSHKKPKL